VRALAAAAASAQGDDATRARQALVREVARGEDFFRSAVIEALGDYKAPYAIDALIAVAKLDGPLAGRRGAGLGENRRQARAGDPGGHPAHRAADVAAVDREPPSVFWASTVIAPELPGRYAQVLGTRTPAFQELLRGAAAGLGALAVAGHAEAARALVDVGVPSRDPTRAPVSLALATVALRKHAP